MTTLPWFRMYHEFATDPKVQMLSEVDQRRFVMLLCIYAKYKDSDISDADLAWRMRIERDAWTETKKQLVSRGLMNEQNRPTYHGVRGTILRPSKKDWSKIRSRIFKRDNYTCQYCGAHGVRLQCDHVVPVTRGGDHSDDNLVTACEPCNLAKRDKIVSIEEWKKIRKAVS